MNSLTCERTISLLPKYIENSLSDEDAKQVEEHLCKCNECFEKYLSLKSISDKIKNAFEDINSSDYTYEQKFFKNNISAFLDNELDRVDNLAISCYIAKSKQAKEEAENFQQFENFLQQQIETNKNLLHNDLSKKIIEEIKKESPEYIYNTYIKAAVITVFFVALTICAGYFSIPDNLNKITAITSRILTYIPFN